MRFLRIRLDTCQRRRQKFLQFIRDNLVQQSLRLVVRTRIVMRYIIDLELPASCGIVVKLPFDRAGNDVTGRRYPLFIDAQLSAALGDSYVLLSSYGGPAPAISFARAQQAAGQALQLDSSLAEAHTVLAAVKVGFDWDWQGAANEYRQALALDPNYPTAHHWYSLLLARIGQFPEAETEIQHALDLDPLSLIINTDAGEVFYCARQQDEALAHLRRALELDPNFAEAHLVLGKVYEQKKDFTKALAESDRADQLFGNPPNIATLRAHALAMLGKGDEALAIAHNLEETSAHRYVSSVDMAMIYCALEDRKKATNLLDEAYQSRGEGLDIIGTDPLFDGCRSDPRFQALLRRLHLVP